MAIVPALLSGAFLFRRFSTLTDGTDFSARRHMDRCAYQNVTGAIPVKLS